MPARRRSLIIPLLVLAVIVFADSAWAGPASPDPIWASQPDGTEFPSIIKGDEYLNWVETIEGYSIIQNPATGYWEYAVPGPNGSLAPSGEIFRPNQAPPATISPFIQPSSPNLVPPPDSYLGTWSPKPMSGAKNILVILTAFADRALSTTSANWNNTIFSATPGVKSVVNFYKDNSFSTMSVNPISHTQTGSPTGIVSVTLNRNHPNYGSTYTWSTEQPWLQEAMTLAGAFVNFDAFDTSNDGVITREELVVYLIVAGYERSGSLRQPNIWAHAWWGLSGASPILTAGTKTLDVVALNGELNDNSVQHPIGVVVHELGHQMCGLPDLYDTASSNANGAMGYFSVMASGSWARDNNEDAGTTPTNLDIWSREFLGWTTPVLAHSASGLTTLGPAISTNKSAIKFLDTSKTSTEYFLMENRYPTGWDAGLRRISSTFQGGLLITHVDIASTPGSNDFNRSGVRAHQGCVPEQASTVFCDMIGSSCRGDQTTLFYAGNNANFGPSTSPNSNYYSLGASNFSVTNISAIGQNMTMTVYSPVNPTFKAKNDFNGDGKADILWQNSSTGMVYIYLMNGTSLADQGSPATVADANWKIVGLGDFDGDGKFDILWQNSGTGMLYIYLMNGTSLAGQGSPATVADANWKIVGVGDFDGDGKADVLWQNSSTGMLYIYLINGTSIAGQGSPATVSDANWKIVGVGDFDSDGKADILWQNSSTGMLYIYLMNGTSLVGQGSPATVSDANWKIITNTVTGSKTIAEGVPNP